MTLRARAKREEEAAETEIESLRECNGALQWLTKENRPDLAVQVNMSQQAMSDPRVRDCRHANNVVQHDLGIRVLPIPLKQIRLVLHSDAAFQNARGGRVFSLMIGWLKESWRSYNMKRVVSTTLATETQSLLNGLGHAAWIAAHLARMRCPNFDVERRSKDVQHVKLHCVVDAKSVYALRF